MTTANKVIKYSAIAFAVFLIVSIFTAILNLLYCLVDTLVDLDDNGEHRIVNVENVASYLDVDLKASNLTIKKGTKLFVETNNDKIKINQNDNKVTIKEKGSFLNRFRSKKDIIIYIPEDLYFEIVNISTGAGSLNIEDLKAKKLDLDLGAGKTTINNLESNNSKIETGAGKVEINNSKLNNLNLDLGVGKIDVNGSITGNSKIECGVGSVNLNLTNSINDYTFKIEKGLGSISINDDDIKDDSTVGIGINTIDIEGGIGSINIKTNN